MKKLFLNLFLFVLIVGCKTSEPPKTEDDYYWSFKPVYDSQEKALRWGACSNKLNLDEIPGYMFIPVTDNNEFRKGLPYKKGRASKYTSDDYISYLPVDYNSDEFRQRNAPNTTLKSTSANTAFNVSNEYSYFKTNLECNAQGNCTYPTEEIINRLGTNCANPDGSYRPPMCSIIAYPFNSKVLTITNYKNTELQCSYQSDRLYPTLKADIYTQTCQADYVFDGTKDKSDGLPNNNRYVYINVVVKAPEDVTADYYVLFKDPNKPGKSQGISLKRGAISPDTVRYCESNRDELRYVIKFQLSGSGNYIASLYNWSNSNNYGFSALESTSFSVNSMDQYNDVSNNVSLNSTNRKLVLQPLLIPNMPLVSTLSVEGKSNFVTTLETAFSLNEKKPMSTSNNPDLLKKGIEFTVNAPTTFASRYFDNYGNIKVRMSSVRNHIKGYDPSFKYFPYQLTSPYTEAISETYKLISADYWAQNPNTDNTVVFYANSIIMVDDNWQPYSTNLDLKVSGNENLFTPNLVLMPNFGGHTGPGSGMNNFLQYLNICGVFKQGMSNYMGVGVSTVNAAAITLIHEIAHSWGQNQMAYKWNDAKVSDEEIHNHFCTGYNRDQCVFRYGSTEKLKENYAEHNKKGVIWCESHKQILMNQLMRKFYAQ